MIIELTSFQFMVVKCVVIAVIFIVVCAIGRLTEMPWLLIAVTGLVLAEVVYLDVVAPEMGLPTTLPDMRDFFVINITQAGGAP